MNLTASANSFYHYLKQRVNAKPSSEKSSLELDKKNLEDLFHFPFRRLATDYFLAGEMKVNKQGELMADCRMALQPAPMGLFETVEIFRIGSAQQVIFRSEQDVTKHIFLIKNLVNQLHQVYGKDDADYVSFTDKDVACLQKGEYWSGRLWQHDLAQERIPVNLYADEEGLTLSIMLNS